VLNNTLDRWADVLVLYCRRVGRGSGEIFIIHTGGPTWGYIHNIDGWAQVNDNYRHDRAQVVVYHQNQRR
jgi:hypothetical protein